ncbi:GIY-YIG nuclease family protein [Vibrio sp. SCSIO 43153]|uniref:GIY-YIG nuclease family protein n=1 Tax=Vibrio sp. SCSIO 43153 TaxID=2819098 RepID=UPI002075769B|nr:GIY-YIG nuclease family protein [Vibrio sp. SCSIO 43153]USD48744.1 GIY-YIG nuclease family protein [Vibrio sp. SCSIO 43153]
MSSNFDKFKFTDEMVADLEAKFCLVAKDANLYDVTKNDIELEICHSLQKDHCNVTGVYFWVMEIQSQKYRIYVGKTKSLSRRLSDYFNNFQIHSPNDCKLKFFQSYVLGQYPSAKFELYFMPCGISEYTQNETQMVNTFMPLINERARVSQDTKNKMKQAFREYYDSVFQAKINK